MCHKIETYQTTVPDSTQQTQYLNKKKHLTHTALFRYFDIVVCIFLLRLLSITNVQLVTSSYLYFINALRLTLHPIQHDLANNLNEKKKTWVKKKGNVTSLVSDRLKLIMLKQQMSQFCLLFVQAPVAMQSAEVRLHLLTGACNGTLCLYYVSWRFPAQRTLRVSLKVWCRCCWPISGSQR